MLQPLLAGEQIFAVLGAASDAKPLEAWRALAADGPLNPIWAGTAYAEWDEVMPYVGIVGPGSPFLDWAVSTQALDWGWLAVSSCPLETVVGHLQGLTKVYLPDGMDVFLRVWDGAQMLPIIEQAGGEILPVFQRYLINGQPLSVVTGPVGVAQASPWWRVPERLLSDLAGRCPQTLIDNLLQWLQEQRPDLHTAFTPTTLRHKVAYLARNRDITPEALADYLASELS